MKLAGIEPANFQLVAECTVSQYTLYKCFLYISTHLKQF